jgi:O-antigen/teichoic acid export membrane protein
MNIKKFLISKYKDNKQLANSFKWRLTQILFKQGTTAVMFFVATYFLPKRDMGIYNYISSVLLLLALITDFGISTATSRYITLYNTQDKKKVKKVFFNSSLLIFTASVLVMGVIFFFRDKLFPEIYSEYLLYALPMVFIYPMTSLMDGIYRGLKKFKRLALFTIANSVVGISASYFLVTSLGLLGAVISPLVFFTFYLLLLIVFYKGYSFKLEKKILKDIVGYSFFFGVAALGHYFFSRVNILILGSYDLLEEIAVYELLNKIYNELLIPFIVLGHILAPMVVELFARKEDRKMTALFKKLLKYLLLSVVIFVPVSMLLSYFGISIVFPIYSGEILNTIILPVTLTYAVAVPVVVINAGMITSTGHAKLMAIQNVVSGIVNVGLNIIVIRMYGYLGVVWVTFVVQLVSTIVLYKVYYLKLKRLG